MNETNHIMERLDGQVKWYSDKSKENKNWFHRLKVGEIVAAAMIPFAAGFEGLNIVTGLLGVTIVILEGLQSLYQYHDNWLNYRSTNEALKHEKHLWKAKAGMYKNTDDLDALLAERVEYLISKEHEKWVESQAETGKVEKKT